MNKTIWFKLIVATVTALALLALTAIPAAAVVPRQHRWSEPYCREDDLVNDRQVRYYDEVKYRWGDWITLYTQLLEENRCNQPALTGSTVLNFGWAIGSQGPSLGPGLFVAKAEGDAGYFSCQYNGQGVYCQSNWGRFASAPMAFRIYFTPDSTGRPIGLLILNDDASGKSNSTRNCRARYSCIGLTPGQQKSAVVILPYEAPYMFEN